MHSFIRTVLSQCDPPLVVHDLLAEVQDGRVLMALLEQLSGCKLVRMMPKYGINKEIIILSGKKSLVPTACLSFKVKVPVTVTSQRNKNVSSDTSSPEGVVANSGTAPGNRLVI